MYVCLMPIQVFVSSLFSFITLFTINSCNRDPSDLCATAVSNNPTWFFFPNDYYYMSLADFFIIWLYRWLANFLLSLLGRSIPAVSVALLMLMCKVGYTI